MANPTLNISVRKDRGSVDFGRLIPMAGNTYALNITGGDQGDSIDIYVMSEDQKICLAHSVTDEDTDEQTIAFNTAELREEFLHEWHEVRCFHTIVSDGTNTIAEGDLSICWNPAWTDATTGTPYSMKGPKGDTGPGISNIEFLNYDVSGNSVYRFTISNGSTYNVVIRKGDAGVGILRIESVASVPSGNKYDIVLTNGSRYSIICPKGPQGDAGRGISTIVLNADNTLTFTYTDGQTYTSPSVKGERGEKGDQGDGSYIFDQADGKWHNISVFTDEFGEKVVNVNPVGVDVRPPVVIADDHLDTSSTAPVQNKVIAKLVPNDASQSNQLADKAFVNSSIATNTGNYISDDGEPFQSLAALEAYAGSVTNNDYAFVVGTDGQGNTTYSRYKYSTASDPAAWSLEYVLNNSSFTAAQWASIQSGITSGLVTKLNGIADGAQANVIESVSINGTQIVPLSKAVGISAIVGTDVTNSNANITDARVVSSLPASPDPNTLYFIKE